VLLVAPTAKAEGLFAGLKLVPPTAYPPLPAAKTGRIFADRKASKSGSN